MDHASILPPELVDDLDAAAGLPAPAERLERAALGARVLAPAGPDDERTRTEVVALETLRLELLRLHTMESKPTELSRELSTAMRLGDHIGRVREPFVEPTPH